MKLKGLVCWFSLQDQPSEGSDDVPWVSVSKPLTIFHLSHRG